MTSARTPLTLAILNDYEVVVRGVAAMLAPFEEQVTVVELDSGLGVSQPVDIALYDAYTMEGLDDGTVAAVAEDPNVGKLVVFSEPLPQEAVDHMLQLGAAAVLPKSLGGRELVEAVLRIHGGEHPGAPQLRNGHPPEHAEWSWPGREEGLTSRESEIIALITDGLSNNDIAGRLYLSINTVKSYIRSAYRTMGVDSRSQAVLWGIDHGFARQRRRVLPAEGARPAGPRE